MVGYNNNIVLSIADLESFNKKEEKPAFDKESLKGFSNKVNDLYQEYLNSIRGIDIRVSEIKSKLVLPSFIILSIIILLSTISLILTPIFAWQLFDDIEVKITFITVNSVTDLLSIIAISFKLFKYVSSISGHHKNLIERGTKTD